MNKEQAKKLIANKLTELGLPAYKLSAKTINFMDLARGECIFVKMHAWQPNSLWEQLDSVARANGFRIED